jgi:cobalt/nickel transport system permease protein
MGIAGGISGYLVWKILRAVKCPLWLAAGFAGLIGDMVTYLVAALELAISLHGNVPLMKQWMIFFMGYAPTQVPLAIAEAVLTSTVLMAMVHRCPDLLPNIQEKAILREKGA